MVILVKVSEGVVDKCKYIQMQLLIKYQCIQHTNSICQYSPHQPQL